MYLWTKSQVSSIFLTSLRQGVILPYPPPPQNEPLKSPPRLELTFFLLTSQFYSLCFLLLSFIKPKINFASPLPIVKNKVINKVVSPTETSLVDPNDATVTVPPAADRKN